MFFCLVCEKEFNFHYQLNGHSKTHKKSKKQLDYENAPSACIECFGSISWKSFRKNKKIEFCCVSCRAKFFYKKAQMIEEKRTIKNK